MERIIEANQAHIQKLESDLLEACESHGTLQDKHETLQDTNLALNPNLALTLTLTTTLQKTHTALQLVHRETKEQTETNGLTSKHVRLDDLHEDHRTILELQVHEKNKGTFLYRFIMAHIRAVEFIFLSFILFYWYQWQNRTSYRAIG